jgi:processing peptidase subunit alpha
MKLVRPSLLLRRAAALRRHAAASVALPSFASRGLECRAFSVATPPGSRLEKEAAPEILKPEISPHAKKQLSLHYELPGLPQLKPASQLLAPQTEITTLPSGLRVISQETYGQAATVGLFVDAGSRCETASEVGVTHLLEHLGFKGTPTRSHAELVREMESIGALATASCGREQIIYTVDVLRDNVAKAVELLADSVLNVEPSEEDLDAIKTIMQIQTEDLMENPQMLLQEYVHLAAYGADQALGRPLQCPLDQIGALSVETVQRFRQKHFVADKMVVAGSGIDHATLVQLAQTHFAHVAASDPRASYAPPASKPSPVEYRGGLHVLDKPETDFSYVALAFPTGGWHADDLVPVCVLHTLLGGGDSFSAGGPGKGMYSRLYTSVLNRFYWVESAFAFSSIHNDVGLLGIYGAGAPSHTSNLVALLLNQLLHVCNVPVDSVELQRAKNQLKSSVLMNLESRMILYEDIGRQLLTYGARESPESVCAKIDAVTAADLQRVLRDAMEHHRPSVVYHGDARRFPTYDQVLKGLEEGMRRLP